MEKRVNLNEVRQIVRELLKEDHITSDVGRLNFIKSNLKNVPPSLKKEISDKIKRIYNKVEEYIGYYDEKK